VGGQPQGRLARLEQVAAQRVREADEEQSVPAGRLARLAQRLAALVEHARSSGVRRISVERFAGEPVAESEAMPLLEEVGFVRGPRRAVLRP